MEAACALAAAIGFDEEAPPRPASNSHELPHVLLDTPDRDVLGLQLCSSLPAEVTSGQRLEVDYLVSKSGIPLLLHIKLRQSGDQLSVARQTSNGNHRSLSVYQHAVLPGE